MYLNNVQLTHIKDYNFNIPGYVSISAGQVETDTINIHEYENTDGSFIAPTPSKLGLFPKYYPELTIDDTVLAAEPETTCLNIQASHLIKKMPINLDKLYGIFICSKFILLKKVHADPHPGNFLVSSRKRANCN